MVNMMLTSAFTARAPGRSRGEVRSRGGSEPAMEEDGEMDEEGGELIPVRAGDLRQEVAGD